MSPTEVIAAELAQCLIQDLEGDPSPSRILVGIAGIPASGKSTIALRIAHHINQSRPPGDEIAIVVGLDGWHYTRAVLDTFDNVEEAHARRGAAFTFDASAYVDFVVSLRQMGAESTEVLLSEVERPPDHEPRSVPLPIVRAPSFSHTLKDPTPDAIHIRPAHRIVILEGLYTFLGIEPWRRASELLDERWFVEIEFDEARSRLIKRHVATGVARDEEEACWRADHNDLPNGHFVVENMLPPTRRIQSVADPAVALLFSGTE
ncbi:hypothetical protein BOTBODRAFT_577684 [Botryobasidium botryosum FD-172 SS1]|uniref:Phosphoribulokinase/uridine kinase domain-containing protein n=1 Tax=Botryobasidium botryosum (strain FD-172 SS1) TaxID=930990 RepID=A0A067N1A8_BOTB1|nr:hypothetical protein BOTBODRAFT_577684 [Botryobasidium botryosum FD-172 SS1]